MALEKQLWQINDELRYNFPHTFNSLESPPSNDAIIINGYEEVENLEPKKKRRILGSWWDNVEGFDELSVVVKGPQNDPASRRLESWSDSCFSSTDLHETKTKKKKKDEKRSSLSSHHDGFCNILYKQDLKSLVVKEERTNSVSKSNTPTKAVKAESAPAPSASASTRPINEDEIRAVLMEKKQVTTKDLVYIFKARLETKEDKNAFANILRKISKIQKNADSQKFVVLGD